jgi:hypothetical protein
MELLPFKIDVGKTDLPTLAQIFAPVVPSFALIATVCWLWPQSVELFAHWTALGARTKLAIGFGGAYVIALMASVITDFFTGAFSTLLALLLRRFFPTEGKSRDLRFRQLASKYLGEYAPENIPYKYPEILVAELGIVDAKYGTGENGPNVGDLEKMNAALGEKVELWRQKSRMISNDFEWQSIYLQLDRLLRPNLGGPSLGAYMLQATAACATVIVTLLFVRGYSSPWAFVAPALVILLSTLEGVAYQANTLIPDWLGGDLESRLLVATKPDAVKRDSQGEPSRKTE